MISPVSLPIKISMLSLILCIVRISSESLEEKSRLPLLDEFSIHHEFCDYLLCPTSMV